MIANFVINRIVVDYKNSKQEMARDKNFAKLNIGGLLNQANLAIDAIYGSEIREIGIFLMVNEDGEDPDCLSVFYITDNEINKKYMAVFYSFLKNIFGSINVSRHYIIPTEENISKTFDYLDKTRNESKSEVKQELPFFDGIKKSVH